MTRLGLIAALAAAAGIGGCGSNAVSCTASSMNVKVT